MTFGRDVGTHFSFLNFKFFRTMADLKDEPDAGTHPRRSPPVLFWKAPLNEEELQNILNEVQETSSFTKVEIEKVGKCEVPFCLYENSKCVQPKTTLIFKPALDHKLAAYLMTACEKHAFSVLDSLIDGNSKQKFVSKLLLYNLVRLCVKLNIFPAKVVFLLEIFMDALKTFFLCRTITQNDIEVYFEERIINHSVFIAGKGKKYFTTRQVEEVTRLFGRFIRLMPLIHVYYYPPFVLKWNLNEYQPPDNRDCGSDTNLRLDKNVENVNPIDMDQRPKIFPNRQKLTDCRDTDDETDEDEEEN